ncbi:hypothetical protein LSTR_LSTR017524 [Laodelphax striatellus]|uniref:Uncharacterized protein n=1 Tax=Laodelphax striatellus TaxID=195883 RepID=A0A482X5Q8_LAOST|nr:hypothetical protein LSTR_LSTR017524 [Laodelphax striatellus]
MKFSLNLIFRSSYPFFVFSLEAFFLLGLSSHLTKLLLVYTEIIYLPKVKDMKLTVVGVINGFTLLIVLCNHLSYNSTRWRMESWWLMRGTFLFYAFIICISVMSAMFLFLYVSVMKRLAQLSSMKSISKEQTKAIKKR